ncbi:dihydropteroate synthase [Cobetia litoralis]|uniref:dihydropteroate synthase n=2 Tax=Halomonadaceae TaxID=28256 RepID=UPI001CEFB388|nr:MULTISPECIES: dihydropteroate synthase [Cobetia]MDH2422898.1 dihydropteroate synthase [Cobetia litoralis]MDH2448384.1 dihydropteroate synthase [Cobetia sp. 2AS]
MSLECAGHHLDLSRPRVMGILNVTPDSFSDGGRSATLDAALRNAEQMLADGAAMIDVGGESTRPGATPVSTEEELERVCPVVERLVSELGALVSIDTSNPQVMRETARLGAGMINDVRALNRDGALEAAAASGLPVCLMHMRGEPDTMQQDTHYAQSIEQEVRAFLAARIAACEAAGIARERLLLDPGFGFGKSLQDNLRLYHRMAQLHEFNLPLLIGTSRKSMIGNALGRAVEDRLAGNLALTALAVRDGARLFRVHDVAPTVDAVDMAWAVLQEGTIR